MSTLIQDVRYGFRMLARTPVVSLVAMLSLALGIAGASAMFAMASGFFLEPLPFGDQDGLVLIRQLRTGETEEFASGLSVPNFRDLEAGTTAFSGLTLFNTANVNMTGLDQPERIQVATGTPNFFDVLRIQPWMGRGFRTDDGAAGANRVIVLLHAYWEARFLSDPTVIGRTIQLDGQPYQVIGVMPESFEMMPANVQAIRPSDFFGREDRGSPGFIAMGRLSPSATWIQAQTELNGTFGRLRSEYPEANDNWHLLVQPARKLFPGPTDTKMVLLLLVVALFGVGIACANVANLLLGRAEMRMKEIAVRTSLGARRARIIRQLLTESVLLSLSAGFLGSALSYYIIRGIQSAMPPVLPKSFWPTLDVPTLVATVVVAMLAGILFGLAPAIHATGGSLREVLGEGTRGGTAGRSRKRIRNIFIIGEIAVALGLLTGAGFLIKAMDALLNTDPGYETNGLVTFQMTLAEYRYADDAAIVRFEDEAIRVLGEIPQVTDVAIMTALPRGMQNPSTRFHVEGTPPVEPNRRPGTGWQAANPAYFSTLRIPLVAGRLIEASDRADTRRVAVVSREFAERWLDGTVNAIGKRLEMYDESWEVVGVVNDVLESRVPLDSRPETMVYLPISQRPMRSPSFAVRSNAEPSALAADVRRVISGIDPDQPVASIRSLDDFIRESLGGPRAIGVFVLALGSLAMVLAAIGIYGVMSHAVVQARREIGIRMAMGAREGQVVRMITGRGLLLTTIGLAAGIPIALLVRRAVMSSLNLFDFDLSPDYALGAAGLLVVVAGLACWLPARRAARIEPVQALQTE
jgi:putative ABC transport system permease protein